MEVNEIYELLDKVDNSSLTEFQYKKGDLEITIKKEKEIISTHVAAPASYNASVPVSGTPAQGGDVRSSAPEEDGFEIIVSPLVGTFYRAPAPDAPPFAEEGDKINSGSTLCILEAMKMMNEFEAEFDCEIVKILVENSTMVEYGTPLFKVKKA